MAFEITTKKDWVLIEIEDRLDSFNYENFKDEFSKTIGGDPQKQVAINLGRVNFISLPSIKYITSMAEEIFNRGGKVALVAMPEKIKRQIDIYASLEAMEIFRSMKEWEEFI